jgi:hypothetical protein
LSYSERRRWKRVARSLSQPRWWGESTVGSKDRDVPQVGRGLGASIDGMEEGKKVARR